MKLNKKSHILSISHWDLDGSAAQIVLGNFFDNVEYHNATFTNIDHMITTLASKFGNYDAVIFTDVYPKDTALIDISDNIILLDHHETDKLHNPTKNRYVITDVCGALLTKNWIETKFNVNLSYLNDLVYLVNDYDLWIHNDSKSKDLNELFGFYRETKFRNRFMNGDVEFTKREHDYLKKRSNELLQMWEELTIYNFEKINACLVNVDDFPNEICERLYTREGYDVVFAINKNSNISVRTGRDDINLGKVFTELEIGGGHRKSSGIRGHATNAESLKIVLEMSEKELYRRYPQIRKRKKRIKD